MSHRPRKHIPLKSQLASALACLLPQAERDAYRAARVAPEVIIRLFSPDHIHLFSLGGSDAWWNLDPKRRPAHAEKSRRDTAIAAKVKRIERKNIQWAADFADEFHRLNNRSGRKIPSRPFPPKGSRPFRSVAPAQRPPPR